MAVPSIIHILDKDDIYNGLKRRYKSISYKKRQRKYKHCMLIFGYIRRPHSTPGCADKLSYRSNARYSI